MSVIVRVGQVDDGEKVYKFGDIIGGLSERDEQELLAAGVVDVFEQDFDEPKENKDPADPPASDNEEKDSDDELEPEEKAAGEGPNITIPGLDNAQKNKRNK